MTDTSQTGTSTDTRTNGHRANGHSQPGGGGEKIATDAREWDLGGDFDTHTPGTAESLMAELLETGDLPDRTAALFEGALADDHALSNLTDDHLWYRRHVIENDLEALVASAPPEGSFWVGDRRDAGGLSGLKRPFKPTEFVNLRETADAAVERNQRSLEGWFLELLAKQSAERREVVVEDDDDGLLSKFFGGGR